VAVYCAKWTERIGRAVPRADFDSQRALVGTVTLASLVIAGCAAAVMIKSVGGAWILIQYAMAFRAGAAPVETEWLFLRNLVLFAVPASFLACGHFLHASRHRFSWAVVFAVAVLLAIAGLLHSGGRLSLAAYLAVFVTYACSRRDGRISGATALIGAVAGMLMIVFGKYALWIFVSPEAVDQAFWSIIDVPRQLLVMPLLEFSFPVYSLANTLDVSPFDVPLRWFVDFPLALVTLLPQKLLGLDQPMIIALVNQQVLNHPVPPDLLGTGYFSAGAIGALGMAAGLAVVTRVADAFFKNSSGTGRLIGLAWAILLGFRVMYGDPTHALFSGLGLIACTAALLAGSALRRRSRRSGEFVRTPVAS